MFHCRANRETGHPGPDPGGTPNNNTDRLAPMKIIQITPEELRVVAVALRDEAKFLTCSYPLKGGPSEGAIKKAESYRITAAKFSELANKLDADKLDAMTFCAAKVEGVQA